MSWRDLGISDPGPLGAPTPPAKPVPKVPRLLPSRPAPAPAVTIVEPEPRENPAVAAAESLAVSLERLATTHEEAVRAAAGAVAMWQARAARARRLGFAVGLGGVLLGVLIAILT